MFGSGRKYEGIIPISTTESRNGASARRETGNSKRSNGVEILAIDFSNMLDDDDDAVLHPREVFFTLNRHAGFSFPRDIQTEVMNRWFEVRDQPDNVI